MRPTGESIDKENQDCALGHANAERWGEEEEPVQDTASDWGGRRKMKSYVPEAQVKNCIQEGKLINCQMLRIHKVM